MSALLEKIKLREGESFFIGIFQDNLEKSTWHYHNSFEISFITEGSGRRIVADSSIEFQPGDLVFIGERLPHVWIPDKNSPSLSGRTLEMVYLRFTINILPSALFALPEFFYLKKAIEFSERGIQIVGNTLNEVSRIMLQLPFMNSIDRMLNLYKMLDLIGRSESNIFLASPEYIKKRFKAGNQRIADIHEFLMNNYRDEVNLKEIANLANMAEGSVCRFFKANVGMSIFEYLNKIKVDFACQLLTEERLSVLEVALDSGFGNLSHFNKQFKKITGQTPMQYRKQFKALI